MPGPGHRGRSWILLLALAAGNLYGQTSPAGGAFDWNQRWRHYAYRTYSWQRMGMLGVDSGLDHLLDEPRQWGRSPESLSYRFGTKFAKRVVRNSVELGVGAAFDEDIRFRPSRSRSLHVRLRHAAVQSFSAYRGDRRGFSYSRLAGTLAGVLASRAWDPRPLTAPGIADRLGGGYLGHVENSFLAEFGDDLKGVGRRLWRRLRMGKGDH